MGLRETGIRLNQALDDHTLDATRMSPYQVANFLQISCESLLNYIQNSNEKLAEDDPGYINPVAIDKIQSFFYELSTNFFPVAHTDSPLASLRIVDRERIHQIGNTLNELRHFQGITLNLSNELLVTLADLDN